MRDNYNDRIAVEADGPHVITETWQGSDVVEHSYTPAKARKLAKKLRAAADEVEGGEAPNFYDEVVRLDEPAPTAEFAVGDKVRVSENPWVGYPGGYVDPRHAGQIGEVVRIWPRGGVEVVVDGLPQEIDQSCLTKVTEPPTYTLTLTQPQAETLAVVLGRVGGPHGRWDYAGRDSARTHASDVLDALQGALGVDAEDLEERPDYAVDLKAAGTEPNSIYFAPYAS